MNNDASKMVEDQYHEWKFKIYPFTNPPSSKRVITQWSAKFKQLLEGDYITCSMSDLGCCPTEDDCYETEFVKAFDVDEPNEGTLETKIKIVTSEFPVEVLVLGEKKSTHYDNSEIQFTFTVNNPIPVSGLMEIVFTHGDLYEFEEENVKDARSRCFKDSCDCQGEVTDGATFDSRKSCNV